MDNNICQYSIEESAMLKLRQETVLLICIVILATLTRFYLLGSLPKGMTWDEAAIGYNGYSILTTRRDEWLEKLPISFKSFGDYKAPLAVYLNGFSTYFFGMNLFAVRLPFAVAGVLSVLVFYYLLRLLFNDHPSSSKLALIGAFSFASTPWHIHFSRIGFESGIALFFTVCGVYWLLKCFYDENINSRKWFYVLLSAVALAASLYTYHSAKLVIPLLLLFIISINRRNIQKIRRYLYLGLAIFTVLLLPLIKDSVWGHGLERSGVTLFSSLPLNQAIPTTVTQGYLHLAPEFLVFGQTNDMRHGDDKWGVITIVQYLLVLTGLFFYVRAKLSNKLNNVENVCLLGLGWILIGITPAAISQDVPHANRALLALPGYILVSVYGLLKVSEFIHIQFQTHTILKSKIILKMFSGSVLLLHSFIVMSYLHDYVTMYKVSSAEAFSEGYLEAFTIAKDYESGSNGKPQVDKILFTSEYGQPYIYALFVRKTNPIWYQGGSLIKYEFTDRINIGDLERDNALIVAGVKSELDETKAFYTIKDSGGKTRFKFYLTENKE